jgi:hypothetical protein
VRSVTEVCPEYGYFVVLQADVLENLEGETQRVKKWLEGVGRWCHRRSIVVKERGEKGETVPVEPTETATGGCGVANQYFSMATSKVNV